MQKDAKPSWLPISLAFGIPVIMVAGAIAVISIRERGEDLPGPAWAGETAAGQRPGEIEVPWERMIEARVVTPDGNPVPGIMVTAEHRFEQPDPREAGERVLFQKRSDSAGYVTFSIPGRIPSVIMQAGEGGKPAEVVLFEIDADGVYTLELITEEPAE